MHQDSNPFDSGKQVQPLPGQLSLPWGAPPRPDPDGVPLGEAGPPCLACGGATVVSPGSPPHHARVDCLNPACKSWRWLPKPRPERRARP